MFGVEPIERSDDLRLGREAADRVEEKDQVGAETGGDEQPVDIVDCRLLIGGSGPATRASMLTSTILRKRLLPTVARPRVEAAEVSRTMERPAVFIEVSEVAIRNCL